MSEYLPFVNSTKQKITVILVLLSIAAAIALSGNVKLPLDAHETFVVQTTQEMHDRHDWIVPYFNKQPRLNKPPINYWLTGTIAWISGDLDHVKPWHGRFVSAIAGLFLVIFTILVCTKLYDQQTAYIAAVMLVTSMGFFDYSHDARPDMLYSMFCTAGLTAFVFAWKSTNSSRQGLYTYLMWIAYALATLTKGPQIPAMFIISSLVFCYFIKQPLKQTLKLHRFLTGIILFIIIAAPWWIVVNSKLGGSGLEGTQLAGSLLTINYGNVLELYYFYRPLILLVPWVIFIPYAFLNYRKNTEHRPANILMLLLIVIPGIILSFGSQERWFYMLPSIVPMIILLAGGASFFANRIIQGSGQKWFKLIFLLLLILPVCSLVAIFYSGNVSGKLNLIIFSVLLVILSAILIYIYKYRGKSFIQQFTITGIAYVIFIIVLGITNTGWSKDRFENHKLALYAHKVVADQLIYAVRLNPDIYVYYTREDIKETNNVKKAIKVFDNSSYKNLFIIIPERYLHRIPGHINHKIIYKTDAEKNKSIYLVKFEKTA